MNLAEFQEKAFTELLECNEVKIHRRDGDQVCVDCNLFYFQHWQPLKESCPTVRVLCNGTVVKL